MTLASAAALAGSALLAAAPAHVTIKTPGHTPKTGVRWTYSVTARTPAGKPAAGLITMQIVDPIGGVHPVQYGTTTKNIVNRRFKGTFRDFIVWPAETRGIPVKLRATVKAGGKTTVLNVAVTPR